MDTQQFTFAALAFIAFAIPIVGSLWKLFGIREQLQVSILANQHRLELLEQKAEHLVGQQSVFLNGIQERLQVSILANQHRLELLEQKAEHLVDQQSIFLNGIQERLQHVRDRSLHAEEALDFRLSDLEAFIEKTTPFERRKKG